MPAKKTAIKTVAIFSRPDNKEAAAWTKKIRSWLGVKFPKIKIAGKRPDAVIVLGGDGAILEAARLYQKSDAVILGMNLGHVGFLASVRDQEKFLPALAGFLRGDFSVSDRTVISAQVIRGGKQVFKSDSLNDFSIQSLLGMVALAVEIEKRPVQYIHGTGFLIATPTGSTAYNLSAHGPIVMPGIDCLILTELLDHSIPTPSMVIGSEKSVIVKVMGFRERNLFKIAKTGKAADVVLSSDGEAAFPLAKGDLVKISRSPRRARFAELEKNYFFKSLQEKFAFR